MADNYELYCLSYNNLTRRTKMEERFTHLNLNYTFYKGVGIDDVRLVNCSNGAASCMFGHLDMIQNFYDNSEKEFVIFCEDDIYIHKDFNKILPDVIADFKLMNLDILLLGYLIHYKLNANNRSFDFKSNNSDLKYIYHNYPNDLWGTQMYMLTKKHAKYILDKYTIEYSIRSISDKNMQPFSADWTITKEGNRALIYPMLAVEIAEKQSSCDSHAIYHENCKTANYVPELYI